MNPLLTVIFLFPFLLFATPTWAKAKLNPVVQKYLVDLQAQAKKEDPSFQFFSIEGGQKLYEKEFFHSKKHEKRSCHSCHTVDPKKTGSHADTGKKIKPLAPVANSKRFTKKKKIKKWFKRNCQWVMERKCTAKEKGDFLVWIYSK